MKYFEKVLYNILNFLLVTLDNEWIKSKTNSETIRIYNENYFSVTKATCKR